MEPRRTIPQPGPAASQRVQAARGEARRIASALEPGLPFLEAVTRTFRTRLGCESAVLEIAGGAFGPFAYVLPALPQTPEHAAFYSETCRPSGICRLSEGRVTFGLRDDVPFLHCHAFWTDPEGRRCGGHVLPTETFIAEPVRVEGWALGGLAFVAKPDPETNFTLFGPVPTVPAGAGKFFGLRLRPNQDICATLEAFCRAQGVVRAAVRGGVGSLIGAVFADGRIVEPFATEMFIRNGTIGPGSDGLPEAALDVALVDYTGRVAEGRLLRGANPVLITAELVLEVEGEERAFA